MQSIQESQKLINEIVRRYPEMDKEDQLYYKMHMAEVHAMHGLAFALLAIADALADTEESE